MSSRWFRTIYRVKKSTVSQIQPLYDMAIHQKHAGKADTSGHRIGEKMGVTEPWMVTTEGQKNWTAACEREISARFNWNGKWGWMPAVMAETVEKLKELKAKQNARIQEKEIATKKTLQKDPRPLPNSTNHEYGWLATKPEYQIERFGPFPLTMKVRVVPTLQELDEEVIRQDADRAKRAREKKLEMRKAAQNYENGKGTLAGKAERDPGNVNAGAADVNLDGGKNLEHDGESPTEPFTGNAARDGGETEEKAIIPVDHPLSQVLKDPGHIHQGDGRKVKLCCCTARCVCKRLLYKSK